MGFLSVTDFSNTAMRSIVKRSPSAASFADSFFILDCDVDGVIRPGCYRSTPLLNPFLCQCLALWLYFLQPVGQFLVRAVVPFLSNRVGVIPFQCFDKFLMVAVGDLNLHISLCDLKRYVFSRDLQIRNFLFSWWHG